MKKLQPITNKEVIERLKYIVENPKIMDIKHELELILDAMYDKYMIPDYICSSKTCSMCSKIRNDLKN